MRLADAYVESTGWIFSPRTELPDIVGARSQLRLAVRQVFAELATVKANRNWHAEQAADLRLKVERSLAIAKQITRATEKIARATKPA